MRLPTRPGDPDHLLRRVLQANATFSTISGLVWIVGGESLGRWFGRDGSMAADGVGLLIFAGLLAILSTRPRISLPVAGIVVALDVLWLLDAAVKIGSGTFSTAGGWVMAAIALVVLDFALLQAVGIRQSRQQRDATVGEAVAGA